MKINLKAILFGFILVIIFALILNPFIGELGSYLSIIISTIIVGYVLNKNIVNGAFHGAIIGIIGALIAIIVLVIIGGFFIIREEIVGLSINILIDIILGIIGGAIGSMLSKR